MPMLEDFKVLQMYMLEKYMEYQYQVH